MNHGKNLIKEGYLVWPIMNSVFIYGLSLYTLIKVILKE